MKQKKAIKKIRKHFELKKKSVCEITREKKSCYYARIWDRYEVLVSVKEVVILDTKGIDNKLIKIPLQKLSIEKNLISGGDKAIKLWKKGDKEGSSEVVNNKSFYYSTSVFIEKLGRGGLLNPDFKKAVNSAIDVKQIAYKTGNGVVYKIVEMVYYKNKKIFTLTIEKKSFMVIGDRSVKKGTKLIKRGLISQVDLLKKVVSKINNDLEEDSVDEIVRSIAKSVSELSVLSKNR